MGLIKAVNKDGVIEHVTEIALKHRPELRRATEDDLGAAAPRAAAHAPKAKAPDQAAEQAPKTSIPELIGKIKKATTAEDVDALVKDDQRPAILTAAEKRKEELAATKTPAAKTADGATKATKPKAAKAAAAK